MLKGTKSPGGKIWMAMAVGLLFGLTLVAAQPGKEESASLKQARARVAKVSEETTSTLTQSCNRFAFDLYNLAGDHLADKAGNFVIAPYSIAEALGLVYAGAKGPTAEEIAKALHLKLKADQVGPAFASLGIGAGGELLEEAEPITYRFGIRVRNAGGKVEIAEVKKGSPAWDAGLKPKDILVRLGDTDITDTAQFANALDGFVQLVEGEVKSGNAVRRFSVRLNSPNVASVRVRPLLATAFWSPKGTSFTPAFQETAQHYFNAAAESVDWQGASKKARAHINHWIADNTDDNIHDLLREDVLKPKTSLLLTNAVYLESAWRSLFDPKLTEPDYFTGGGKKRKVSMMSKNAKFRYGKGKNFQVVELALEGDFAMTLYLPAAADPQALKKFEEEYFKLDQISTWFEQLKFSQVNVTLPRFRVAAQSDLVPALRELGIRKAFSSAADLSGMTTGMAATSQLSAVVHNAEIEINEKGVRAKGSPALGGVLIVRPVAEFTANRPFLFTIRDTRKGVMLFMGKIAAPEVD